MRHIRKNHLRNHLVDVTTKKKKRIPHLINDAAQDPEKNAELHGIQYELVDH